MSKTKKKLMMNIIVWWVILVGGTCVLSYLTFVIGKYVMCEATHPAEWMLVGLCVGLPIMGVYFLICIADEIKSDMIRFRFMK
jgi:lipid-A-disaccharide synthase-like uncharacterized protein